MKIQAIIVIFNKDRQYAFRYIDTETGKKAEGFISGGESNITASFRDLGLGFEFGNNYFYTIKEFRTERDYKIATKDMVYAGCAPSEIAQFIKDNLK